MTFSFLDPVKIKGRRDRGAFGLVISGVRTSFGETYWIQWRKGDSVMHVAKLRKVPLGRLV